MLSIFAASLGELPVNQIILIVLVIAAAWTFDFINGFHDTANAIATVVSTRVMSPRAAIIMAATANFVGAFMSTAVAHTIAKGIVNLEGANASPAMIQVIVLSAVLGAIVWGIITWKYGIPSSSSHALIGGLVGATLVFASYQAVEWEGVTNKVLLPLVGSPLAGFLIGFVVMTTIFTFCAAMRAGMVNFVFSRLQILTAGAMAFAHGSNDAQKSMGIITLALVGLNLIGEEAGIPFWVIFSCATAMAIGTSMGGWRIIKTMGHSIIRLEPVNGAAAEMSAAIVILGASHMGMPVSTTHVISGGIFGVGASKRLSALHWNVAYKMVVAWVLTLPASAAMAAGIYLCLKYIA